MLFFWVICSAPVIACYTLNLINPTNPEPYALEYCTNIVDFVCIFDILDLGGQALLDCFLGLRFEHVFELRFEDAF